MNPEDSFLDFLGWFALRILVVVGSMSLSAIIIATTIKLIRTYLL